MQNTRISCKFVRTSWWFNHRRRLLRKKKTNGTLNCINASLKLASNAFTLVSSNAAWVSPRSWIGRIVRSLVCQKQNSQGYPKLGCKFWRKNALMMRITSLFEICTILLIDDGKITYLSLVKNGWIELRADASLKTCASKQFLTGSPVIQKKFSLESVIERQDRKSVV